MKSIFLLVVFIILFTENLFAQHPTPTNQPNQVQAESLVKMGEQKMNVGSYAAAIPYFEKSLHLYESLRLPDEAGNSLKQIALAYYYQGNYTKALEFFQKSRYSYQKAKNKVGESKILNNIGAVYYYLGNKLKALELYKQAIEVQKEVGDRKIFAATTQNIGGIYVSIKDYKNGMAYFQQALKLQLELKDSASLSQTLNGIGEIYSRQYNYLEAFRYLNQSLAIANKLDNKVKQLEVLHSLGELFNHQKKYAQALYYYQSSLAISQKINNLQYLSNSKIALGDVFNKTGQSSEAIKSCHEGLITAEKLGSVTLKREACDCLYKSYKSIGNSVLALRFYEKATIYKDSLRSEEIASQAQSMEFQKQQLADSITHARKEYVIQQKHKEEVRKKEQQRNYIFVSLGFLSIVAIGLWSRLNYVRRSKKILQKEKDRSENLLLNILPKEIADELMEKGSVEAQNFSSVAILFSDFKSFTQTAEKMSPQSLVEELNVCFKAFDLIVEKYKIEKIKTIGDAYMAAGGLPNPDQQAAWNTVCAALEMQDFITRRKIDHQFSNNPTFEMRVGIHSGPVVAGVVGVKKFQYDVWGDTVNTASRIESNGEPGKVNVSETIYNLLKDDPTFLFDYRGIINAKGKGDIKMYFVKKA
ncbi:adenylate/guanylate cyclase domain-containing protein [Siphonobacter sp. SORGH_AS_1065]|uniref:adenylate/guanylate cyclase domain-containing protein n=1 Tax=Siphonobacter sp. SORGH_AS_1065 TaxID=3041795 RepID=UPI0027869DE0|nr:adenylate/guanylate cyclase domain-containing protein [Siphonobacter sp. SORGH_AS_1065]MDQ1089749.1 adenylate cyclase [Siphonobacter sp. SORGH_AS_1065]